jgi:hypothetical protein
MKSPKPRSAFGWIFLLLGLALFFVLAANSISAELDDVLHQAPLGGSTRQAKAPAIVNKAIDGTLTKAFPTVADLPHIKAVNKGVSTNDNPFQQFNVVRWLGWAFVFGALMEVGVAYLRAQKSQVAE